MQSFQFASFTWPRMVARAAFGPALLRKKWAGRKFVGEYSHAPTPNGIRGRGFYLDNAGQPFTRWKWADDVINLRHITGYFCDLHADQTIRGIVAILPHNRFLAGWSMGEGMASEVDGSIYDTPEDAAYAADSMAEYVAEREREYQEARETEE